MKKILKIILIVFAVAVIVGVSSFSLVVLDVSGNLAADTHPLPNGDAVGKALVVYNPGLSGGAKDMATKIGYGLQESGFDVVLAGVKSSTAANVSGYDIVVVGGPIYAGKPASTVQAYLNNLTPSADAIVGVFGYGDIEVDDSDAVIDDVAALSSDSTVVLTAVTKITSNSDVDAKCQEFVTSLIV